MRKMVIETKLSKWKVAKVIKSFTDVPFTISIKRGNLYVFFAQHIDDTTVFSIAKSLCMEVVSMKARAILRY